MTHAEELERLAELHRKGDLTDEEFAAEKKLLVESDEPLPIVEDSTDDVPRPAKKRGCGTVIVAIIAVLVIIRVIGALSHSGTDSTGNSGSTGNTDDRGSLSDEKLDAYAAATTIVPHYLKSPSSTEFPLYSDENVSITHNEDGSYTIYSPFQASNSFGAKLQSHYRITVKKDAEGWKATAPPEIEEVN